MHRTAVCTVLTVIASLAAVLASPTGGAAASERPAPAQVHREYGDGPVRLAPRQRVEVSFTARTR